MSWLQLISFSLFCLMMEAFFSSSELAIVSADKLKLTHKAKKSFGAKTALALANKPAWFFSTTLLGQSFFIVANSIFLTLFIFDHYGHDKEYLGLLLSPFIIIFGEAVPKTLAQEWADWIAPRTAPIIWLFSYLLFPIIWLLSQLTLLLLGGVQGSLLHGHEVTRESLEALIKSSQTSREVSQEFKNNLLKILTFSYKQAHEVMTPLIEVVSLRDNASIEEAIEVYEHEGYSNLPIFKKRSYNIIGKISYFDLLLEENLGKTVGQIMETPLYIPEEMNVKDLFYLFRENRQGFAVVVDEYGASVGIITMEDIMEEIVGQIQDEFDEEILPWSLKSEKQVLVQARTSINDLNDQFHWNLPKGDYETLAGFLLNQFGKIPATGEVLHYGLLTFLIKSATPKSIDEVLIEWEK